MEEFKIFISFSFFDEQFAKSLAEFLIGVIGDTKKIYCVALDNKNSSSVLGSDFSEGFIEEVKKCSLFVPLLSNNYKKSTSSMIELGAALCLEKNITPFMLPNFEYVDFNDFYNIRNTEYYKLNDKKGINKFLSLLSPIVDNVNGINVDDFITEINEINKTYINDLEKITFCTIHPNSKYNCVEFEEFINEINKDDILDSTVIKSMNEKVEYCVVNFSQGRNIKDLLMNIKRIENKISDDITIKT